jgi:hypothetical protein
MCGRLTQYPPKIKREMAAIGVEPSLVAIADIRGFKCKRGHGTQPTSEDYESDGGHCEAPFGAPRRHGGIKAEALPLRCALAHIVRDISRPAWRFQ